MIVLYTQKNCPQCEGVKKLLKEKNKKGKTIIVVTHYKKLFQRWKINKYEF